MCGVYKNEIEKANLLYWQVTCESFYTPKEWRWFFEKTKYKGDYSFIYFKIMKINQKIKAAILEENFKPLAIKNIFLKNKLKKKQILVKNLYSGICGSQIGEINSIKGKDKFLPHLLGHEATGKVVNVFNKKSKFKIGDKVVLHWQKWVR